MWEFLSKGAQSERMISVALFEFCQCHSDYLKNDFFFKFHNLIINHLYRSYEKPEIYFRNTILEALESFLFSAMTACRISIKTAENKIAK